MKLKCLLVFAVVFALLFSAMGVSAETATVKRPEITIGRFNNPPKIDGNFSEAEWGTKSFKLAEGEKNVTAHKEKSGEEELPLTKTETDVYLGYDETHLYLCVVADYAKHSAQALLGSKLWADDSLQTKISATPDGPNYNDIDFGLNTTTNRALAHVWNGNGVNYGQLSPGEGKDFMIKRSGTKTIYEISYPLKSFATTVLKLKEGDKLAFSIAQHMSEKGGFYEFAGGIVNSKEITSAGILILGAAKKLPTSNESNKDKTSSTKDNKKPVSSSESNKGTTSSDAGNKGTASSEDSNKGTVSANKNTGTTSSNNGNTSTDKNKTENTSKDENTTVSDDSSNVETEIVDTSSDTESESEEVIYEVVEEENDDKGMSMGVFIGILAGIIVVLGVAAYFLLLRPKK